MSSLSEDLQKVKTDIQQFRDITLRILNFIYTRNDNMLLRTKTMKTSLFILLIFSFAFWGCKEKSNPVQENIDGTFVIAGKIENYSNNFTGIYSMGCNPIETEIKGDGSFTIKIPIPDDICLATHVPYNDVIVINGDTTYFIDSINISNKNVKYTRYDLYAKSSSKISYSLPLNLAKITNPSNFAAEGDYYISYYFFTESCVVKGYAEYRIVTSDSTKSIVTEYNINVTKGWNKVITKFIHQDIYKSVYEVTEIKVNQGSWIIGARDAFTNLSERF